MHREDIPLPPRRLNPAIPEALEKITLKVLSKEPSARYRTADQLGRVLLSFGSLNREKTGPIVLPQAGSVTEQFTEQPSPQSTVQPTPSAYRYPGWDEEETEINSGAKTDWVAWGLGLLAFAAIFGLIPFWLFIYFSLNP
jgi:serine/threonine-protein kinase